MTIFMISSSSSDAAASGTPQIDEDQPLYSASGGGPASTKDVISNTLNNQDEEANLNHEANYSHSEP